MPLLLQHCMTSVLSCALTLLVAPCRLIQQFHLLGVFVSVYMDNIVVWSSSREEHLCHVLMVI